MSEEKDDWGKEVDDTPPSTPSAAKINAAAERPIQTPRFLRCTTHPATRPLCKGATHGSRKRDRNLNVVSEPHNGGGHKKDAWQKKNRYALLLARRSNRRSRQVKLRAPIARLALVHVRGIVKCLAPEPAVSELAVRCRPDQDVARLRRVDDGWRIGTRPQRGLRFRAAPTHPMTGSKSHRKRGNANEKEQP